MFCFKKDPPAWFEEYLDKDPSREVRFIGDDGYSVHADYLGKRITWTGKRLYKVRDLNTNEILEIEEHQVTDILRPIT